MTTWPGENWVNTEPMTDFDAKGVRVSRLTLGSHTGTHIDAPRHFLRDGTGVDKIDPDKLIGPCSVIEVTPDGAGISKVNLQNLRFEKRVLFKTRNSEHLQDAAFYDDYVFLTEDAADHLIEHGVVLVGIDYLSIEKRGAKGHPVHTKLLEKGVVIIEGVNLSGVEAGTYSIAALPLRIEGLDGSPARVFLEK